MLRGREKIEAEELFREMRKIFSRHYPYKPKVGQVPTTINQYLDFEDALERFDFRRQR